MQNKEIDYFAVKIGRNRLGIDLWGYELVAQGFHALYLLDSIDYRLFVIP